MKTFRQHIKKFASGDATIGQARQTHSSISVEDSNIGVHNIENAEILKRVNAFEPIAEREYMNPKLLLTN